MEITPPLKKAPYEFYSLDELRKLIAQRGQFFGEDKSGPACNWDPKYSCDITFYQALGLGAHNGIDIPCNDGEPIIASHDGVVVETSSDEKAGLGVVLWDKNQLIKTVYWHMKSFPVKVGEEVKRGQIIGLADNTGYSSGTHLHFMLKQTNQNGSTINGDNSYFGAIDPWPHLVWFKNMTEEDVKHLYALAFYRLPDATELGYWVGKDLATFLKTAIDDRAKFLQNEL